MKVAVILDEREITALHTLVIEEARRNDWSSDQPRHTLPRRARILASAINKMTDARDAAYVDAETRRATR